MWRCGTACKADTAGKAESACEAATAGEAEPAFLLVDPHPPLHCFKEQIRVVADSVFEHEHRIVDR